MGTEAYSRLPPAYVTVEAAQRPVAGDATDALVACRQAARATLSGTARAVNVWLLGPFAAAANSLPKMEQKFRECIGPRGYTATRW